MLAMFSLAKCIDIWSRKQNALPVAARIDVEELKAAIRQGKEYELQTLDVPFDWGERTGTRIVLTDLLSGIDKTEAFLRPRVARRFSVLGERYMFRVIVNEKDITPADRGYQSAVEFLWHFDEQSREELAPLAPHIANDEHTRPCIAPLNGVVQAGVHAYTLRGFIASVDKPKKLRTLDANINQISLFANGRVFQEDLLGELGNSQHFNSYLIGEVHADFLDLDEVDRATANREAVKHGDPLVAAIRAHLTTTLKIIALQWDEWRRQLPNDVEDEQLASSIQIWLDSLNDARDRKAAERLVKSISRLEPTNDEDRNREVRRDLMRSTIVGFEKLRIRKQLDRLDTVTDVTSPEFQSIFLTVDDIEATYFHEITRTRLRVIEEFDTKIVEAHALEAVAEKYLFERLWLLDPTWDRVSGSEVMEQTLTKELRKIDPNAETGARLDIAYRTSSGRHVIVELKRPGKERIDVYDLMKQGAKYRGAMMQYFKEHPDVGSLGGRTPSIDVYFVVEEYPVAIGSDAIDIMRKENMQPFTYKGMIANARRAYQEYLSLNDTVSTIETIIAKL